VAYDEALAGRIRAALEGNEGVTERKMFGGIAFMLDGNMCCGVVKDELMVRLSAEASERALAEPGARPMDFTGRRMRGFLFVGPVALASDDDLRGWVGRAVDFVGTLPPK
jgi:TfoX/Sxy family transcriptional regulator of competence genes